MTETFCYQNLAITIVRSSRRKTIAIQIKAGLIFMRVPHFVTKAEIESLVMKKNRWIQEKISRAMEIKPKTARQFVNDELFSCLGQDYKLAIVQGSSPNIYRDQNQLLAIVRNKQADNSALIKRLLIQWYQAQANITLHEKTRYYASMIGVTPANIWVKTFKARWGSCSIKADISYNWKIIMATEEVVDYLVVHELCHILHHNHSQAFWKTLEFYLPNYRQAKEWLKVNGQRLDI